MNLLAYIVLLTSAIPTTATKENASFDKDDSLINRRRINVVTSNSGGGSSSRSSSSNNNNKNTDAAISMLVSNHLNNGSANADENIINNKTQKRVTTRGATSSIIPNGRTHQPANKSGKGKTTNEVDSTCSLDISIEECLAFVDGSTDPKACDQLGEDECMVSFQFLLTVSNDAATAGGIQLVNTIQHFSSFSAAADVASVGVSDGTCLDAVTRSDDDDVTEGIIIAPGGMASINSTTVNVNICRCPQFVFTVGAKGVFSTGTTPKKKNSKKGKNVDTDPDDVCAAVASFFSLSTAVPSMTPSVSPSMFPSATPSVSAFPSAVPSMTPSVSPSVFPSATPSVSALPSAEPSMTPSTVPSMTPSAVPSMTPSAIPSAVPSAVPSMTPSVSAIPSMTPSVFPSGIPSMTPSVFPSGIPSLTPSVFPSVVPSITPSAVPSIGPSVFPSSIPSDMPSVAPPCAESTKIFANLLAMESSLTNATVDCTTEVTYTDSGVYIFNAVTTCGGLIRFSGTNQIVDCQGNTVGTGASNIDLLQFRGSGPYIVRNCPLVLREGATRITSSIEVNGSTDGVSETVAILIKDTSATAPSLNVDQVGVNFDPNPGKQVCASTTQSVFTGLGFGFLTRGETFLDLSEVTSTSNRIGLLANAQNGPVQLNVKDSVFCSSGVNDLSFFNGATGSFSNTTCSSTNPTSLQNDACAMACPT